MASSAPCPARGRSGALSPTKSGVLPRPPQVVSAPRRRARREAVHEMRTVGTAIASAAAWGIGALAASAPGVAAGSADACTLLSTAQVSTILGGAVDEGEHIVPTALTSCGWMGP